MNKIFSLSVSLLIAYSVAFPRNKETHETIIAKGQMPNMTRDKSNTIHIVYGNGDSIMYISSKDGISYTPPSLVSVLPKLMASAMRGPQIAFAYNGLIITACTIQGNIYCYIRDLLGKWINTKRINDANESAREALMALSADGLNAYAIWLGVKRQKGQNVYGSTSIDGGRT